MSAYLAGLIDGMEKVAIKVPVMHGTHHPWEELKAGVGKPVAPNDPNPRKVYMATKSRHLRRGVEEFARKATEDRGGSPTIAHAKIDTKKGWRPRSLTAWGRKHIGSVDDAHDVVHDLTHGGLKGKKRGHHWKKIMKGVSTWHHPDSGQTVRPHRYRPVSGG